MKKIFLFFGLSFSPFGAPATDDCASLTKAQIKGDSFSQFHFARRQLRSVIGEFLDRDKIYYNRYTLEQMEKLSLSREDIENVLRTTNSTVPLDYGIFEITGKAKQKNRLLSLDVTLPILQKPHKGLLVRGIKELVNHPAWVAIGERWLPIYQLSPRQFQQAVGTLFDTKRVHYSKNVHPHMIEHNISQEDIEYVLRNAIVLKTGTQDDDPNFLQVIGSTREIPWLRVRVFFGRKLTIVGAKRLE